MYCKNTPVICLMLIETQLHFRDDNIQIFYGQTVKVLVLKTCIHTLFCALDFFIQSVSSYYISLWMRWLWMMMLRCFRLHPSAADIYSWSVSFFYSVHDAFDLAFSYQHIFHNWFLSDDFVENELPFGVFIYSEIGYEPSSTRSFLSRNFFFAEIS